MPLTNRWLILAVLFGARAAMAFQFQAVAALSPVLMASFGVGLADIGLLIGLYLAPGLALALPGGALGSRFGDRRVVGAGMALMIAGGVLMVLAPGWGMLTAGRLLAGIGGVVLNVLLSKMVTDLFAGRQIATAMGIFVNSWPVGIAAALLVLPPLAAAGGSGAALAAVAGVAALGLLAFLILTPAPTAARAAAPATPAAEPLAGRRLGAVLLAGAVWGLYNGALGMVFGFGPALLVARGWGLGEASAATSLVLWLVALSVPAGGHLADRWGRPDGVMQAGFCGFAVLLILVAAQPGTVLPLFVLIGLCAGLPAGAIMSLPSLVLGPASRAMGMGVFFTLFYAGVMSAPIAAGALSDLAGTAAAAFVFGAGLLALCALSLLWFRRLTAALPPPSGSHSRAQAQSRAAR